jgi:4-hydroxy-tetrahydrodipicolinate reductase
MRFPEPEIVARLAPRWRLLTTESPSMKIRVLVNGAKGRMGTEVVQAVKAEPDLSLAGETDLGDRLDQAIASSGAQVVVDFTEPSSATRNTETILRSGARPVVGTTGFRPEEISRLEALAGELRLGGLIAPNFAIGAILLMKFAAEAVRFLPAVEIIELHHDQKPDAPSGTALKTAELIAEKRGSLPEQALSVQKGREESVPGARGGRYQGIPIHSVRLPGLVAHQEVLLGGLGQLLTIRHDSLSRASFMPGVILAVRKAPRLDRLYYGLEKILEL